MVACCFLIRVSLEDLDSHSVIKYLLILEVIVAVKITRLPLKFAFQNLLPLSFEGKTIISSCVNHK